MLPVEMWQTILRELDIVELTKLKTVSKTFHDLIMIIERNECRWYEKCVEKIPQRYWSSLLKHQNDPEIRCTDFHKYKKHPSMWMKMYKSWIKWSAVLERTSSTRTFVLFPHADLSKCEDGRECIYCVDTLSEIIAIGDNTGRLILYDISKPIDAPFIHQINNSLVEEVVLCRQGDGIVAVASFCDPSMIEYWDVKSQRLLRQLTEPYDGISLGASFDRCCTVQLFAQFSDHVLSIQQLKDDEQFETVRSVLVPCERFERVVTVLMDGDEVMLMTLDYEHGRSRIHGITKIDYQIRDSMPCDIEPYEFKFLDKSVIVRYNDPPDARIGFSVSGSDWKFYDAKNDFHLSSDVTSILYHVGFFIFGLECGELCIIHVGDINNLETFDSKMMINAKRKILNLDSVPIESVNVTEYDSNQYIIAVTDDKLHVVKFD